MSELSNNQKLATQYLQRFNDTTTGHFINGKMLVPEGAEAFDNPSPIDNKSLGKIVAGTTADVDQACDAAQAAFADWRDMPGAEHVPRRSHWLKVWTAVSPYVSCVKPQYVVRRTFAFTPIKLLRHGTA